eukprot:COSAG01_NODE_11582_length_1899_cov_183.131667_2_plen_161_part_00
MLWEPTTKNAQAARTSMRPKLELAVSEARTALSRLLRSQGASDQDAATALAAVSRADGADNGDDDDDDDSIVDETDVRRAQALQALKNDAINLLDDDDDDDNDDNADNAARHARGGATRSTQLAAAAKPCTGAAVHESTSGVGMGHPRATPGPVRVKPEK